MSWRARFGTVLVVLRSWQHMLLAPDAGSLQSTAQRQVILDAIRPRAASRMQQSVRIRVQTLKQVDGWAVLEGALVGATSAPINWTLAAECEPELDKILFAVLRRRHSDWEVVQLSVCATEPPYWDEQFLLTTAAPCAAFAGFTNASGADVRAQCEQRTRQRPTLDTL